MFWFKSILLRTVLEYVIRISFRTRKIERKLSKMGQIQDQLVQAVTDINVSVNSAITKIQELQQAVQNGVDPAVVQQVTTDLNTATVALNAVLNPVVETPPVETPVETTTVETPVVETPTA